MKPHAHALIQEPLFPWPSTGPTLGWQTTAATPSQNSLKITRRHQKLGSRPRWAHGEPKWFLFCLSPHLPKIQPEIGAERTPKVRTHRAEIGRASCRERV